MARTAYSKDERAYLVRKFPGDEDLHIIERYSSAVALVAIEKFLDGMAPTEDITRVKVGLATLVEGGAPAGMFHPMHMKGRRPDVSEIQKIKGQLAGLTHCKQAEGLSREQATAWTANNMPPALASRLSRKPITAGTIEEWLDRFGGNYPPDNFGGRAFRLWSQPRGSELTKIEFRQITERLPSLRPEQPI